MGKNNEQQDSGVVYLSLNVSLLGHFLRFSKKSNLIKMIRTAHPEGMKDSYLCIFFQTLI